MDLIFEWDNQKAETNINKHGVDFVDAVQIFQGHTAEAIDDSEDYGEERIRAIGQHNGAVYVVIYTEREGAIRIISAWKANKNDREKYYASIA